MNADQCVQPGTNGELSFASMTPSALVSTSVHFRPAPVALVLSVPVRSPSTQLALGTWYTAPPSVDAFAENSVRVARVMPTGTPVRSNFR